MSERMSCDLGPLGSALRRGGTQFDGFLTHDWGEDELGRNHGRVSQVCAALKQAGVHALV